LAEQFPISALSEFSDQRCAMRSRLSQNESGKQCKRLRLKMMNVERKKVCRVGCRCTWALSFAAGCAADYRRRRVALA